MSDLTGCEILGKAEFLNPGGSVKDRAALGILNDAIKNKKLKQDGIIVEGTAGNTGISLTQLGNSIGCKTIIVMPETQSNEKKQLLKILGAELVLVPAAPYKNPNNYVRYSKKLSEDLSIKEKNKTVFWANQFDNTSNLNPHFNTTGPEIWEQTCGKVDGFICAIGSGGTIAGVTKYLKKKNPKIQNLCQDTGYQIFIPSKDHTGGWSITSYRCDILCH